MAPLLRNAMVESACQALKCLSNSEPATTLMTMVDPRPYHVRCLDSFIYGIFYGSTETSPCRPVPASLRAEGAQCFVFVFHSHHSAFVTNWVPVRAPKDLSFYFGTIRQSICLVIKLRTSVLWFLIRNDSFSTLWLWQHRMFIAEWY